MHVAPGTSTSLRGECMVRGRLIRLARELRGISLADLALRVSLSPASLCRSELDERTLTPEELGQIASALGVPVGFFSSSCMPCGATGEVHFRRKASTLAGDRRRAVAHLNMAAYVCSELFELLGIPSPQHKFEAGRLRDYADSPDVAAGTVRRTLALSPGPISKLIDAIEQAGVFLFTFDLGPDISGLSSWPKDGLPVICVNSRWPSDRQRWTIAHELGHLALHTFDADPQSMEDEANSFAAEFLMPRSEVQAELRALSIERLKSLKYEWLVSMSALVMRARALDRITEYQERIFFSTFAKRGWRTNEPVQVPRERPTAVRAMLREAIELLGSHKAVASRIAISTDDLGRLLPEVDEEAPLRLVR